MTPMRGRYPEMILREPDQVTFFRTFTSCSTYLDSVGKLRIDFLKVHNEKMNSHLTPKALRGYIQQIKDSLRSASEATRNVVG